MAFRQARGLLQNIDHDVERIGDADDEGLGRVFLDALADRVHDLRVGGDKIVAAHARLTRNAGGDDDDVGALDRLVIGGAEQLRVEAFDRRCLGDIQRLALRHAIDHVEQNDVAQFLHTGQKRQRATDLSSSNKSYLLTRHSVLILRSLTHCPILVRQCPLRSKRTPLDVELITRICHKGKRH